MTPAVIAAIALASSADVPIRDWPSFGGFDIVQLEDGCSLTAEYPIDGRSPMTLVISTRAEGVSIAVLSSDWSSQQGEEYELVYQVGEYAWSGKARGFRTSTAGRGFVSNMSDEFLADIAAAPNLLITRGDVVVANMRLNGSAGAVATLNRCRTYYQNAVNEQSRREQRWDYIAPDPFADPSENAPTDEDRSSVDVLTNPSWASRPMPEFPERALSRNITSGRVTLECTVNANGSVTACSILSEDPPGAGFGQAALSSARRARLAPRSLDALAPDGKVRFTQSFLAE